MSNPELARYEDFLKRIMTNVELGIEEYVDGDGMSEDLFFYNITREAFSAKKIHTIQHLVHHILSQQVSFNILQYLS